MKTVDCLCVRDYSGLRHSLRLLVLLDDDDEEGENKLLWRIRWVPHKERGQKNGGVGICERVRETSRERLFRKRKKKTLFLKGRERLFPHKKGDRGCDSLSSNSRIIRPSHLCTLHTRIPPMHTPHALMQNMLGSTANAKKGKEAKSPSALHRCMRPLTVWRKSIFVGKTSLSSKSFSATVIFQNITKESYGSWQNKCKRRNMFLLEKKALRFISRRESVFVSREKGIVSREVRFEREREETEDNRYCCR